MAPLTGKQRRYLRGLGHHLDPVVQVGKGGVTDGIVAAVEQALHDHELIKIRRGSECPADRHEVADALAARAGAEVVQTLGQTVLLFRQREKEPDIELPR